MIKQSQFKYISGIQFPAELNDFQCQLKLFLNAPRLQKETGAWQDGEFHVYSGQGRFEHARVIGKILFPKAYEWHAWSDLIVGKACESDWLAVCGCGASSKSTSIGLYALIWWMSSPLDSAVIVASKTIDSAKKRIWREVARFYGLFSNLVGGYKDAVIGSSPRPYICPISGADRKKDEAHGLYVTALHGKEIEKEIGYIKGFHPRRVLVVADELDVLEDGGKALVDTFTDNLRTGADEAQIIVLGNDPSLFNALGDVMQPEPGKPVGLQHVDWKSCKGWDCLRLDAFDSPNIKDRERWTGLVRQRDIDDLITRKGDNSPSVWIQLHGLHPPEGSANTVLSEAALIRFHAFEDVKWKREFVTSAALDPAFGGDSCTYRLFRRGNDTQDKMKVLWENPINIPVQINIPENPVDYQIATKVKEMCISHHVPPDEFAIGSTGIGRGVAAILKRDWSPRIVEVQEGGSPSDRIISEEHPVPANKEYDRKVTELWFQIREFVSADMFRGIDSKTAIQLCGRTWEDKGVGGGRKIVIQKKEEMLHSPDEADCMAIGTELLMQKGIIPKITTTAKQEASKDLDKMIEELDFDASSECYSDPLLDFVSGY